MPTMGTLINITTKYSHYSALLPTFSFKTYFLLEFTYTQNNEVMLSCGLAKKSSLKLQFPLVLILIGITFSIEARYLNLFMPTIRAKYNFNLSSLEKYKKNKIKNFLEFLV